MNPFWMSACFIPLLLVTICINSTTFAAIPRYRPIRRSCSVDDPSEALRLSHRWLQKNEPLKAELWDASSVRQRYNRFVVDHSKHNHDRRQTLTIPPLYTIDTYIHIVADSSTADPLASGYVTDSMIQNQFRYLTAAYSNSSIGYRLAGIDRSVNDTWAANGDDIGMKRALRRGTYSALNIYYQSQLQATSDTPGVPAGAVLLGFCSLPAAGVTRATPADNYVIDGCNILSGTMPGGNLGGYNLGGTTAHEVGHWNGLFHTFNGYTCNVADFGDYVADTPQQATSTSKCLRRVPHFASSLPGKPSSLAFHLQFLPPLSTTLLGFSFLQFIQKQAEPEPQTGPLLAATDLWPSPTNKQMAAQPRKTHVRTAACPRGLTTAKAPFPTHTDPRGTVAQIPSTTTWTTARTRVTRASRPVRVRGC